MKEKNPIHFVICDFRPFLTEIHQSVFSVDLDLHNVYYASDLSGALRYAESHDHSEETRPTQIFLIHCTCYLAFLDAANKIYACCPQAKIIILDDLQRIGCGILMEFCDIHGCCTTMDSPEEKKRCLRMIMDGVPAVSCNAEHMVAIDVQRGILTGRPEHLNERLFHLSQKEWECFHWRIRGMSLKEMSIQMSLKYDSAKKLQHRMMKRLGIKGQADLFIKAKIWGLVDY